MSGPGSESHRDEIREGTKRKVAKELGLIRFGQPASLAKGYLHGKDCVALFVDQSSVAKVGLAPAGGVNLLGRYDVLCVRTRADFDMNWKFIQGARPSFWVLHAAAVNIGENRRAADFPDFALRAQSVLDEERYVNAMGHIFGNVVMAGIALGMKHLVFFPFGMGAFLRHLRYIDVRFALDEVMLRLCRKLACCFMQALAHASSQDFQVHLCLQFDTKEAHRNGDAFIRAVAGAPTHVMRNVTIWPDADCLQLAHELAMESTNVCLVNGANRQLIGNNWFAGRALRAIDENLHRRCWSLSAVSYLLNNYDECHAGAHRKFDDLQRQVAGLDGSIFRLDH